MSNKIGLIFVVLLSIAFVPRSSGNESVLLVRMNSLIQSINATSVKDESPGTVDGYIDLFFSTFFDEDDSSEADADLSFGPDFNPAQFMALLNNDIEAAYQRKCKKISGNDDTYSKIKEATKELGGCLKAFLKSDEIRSAYSKLQSEEDLQSLIRTVCRNRDVPLKCMDTFIGVDVKCSFTVEKEIEKSFARIVHGSLDLFCANDGNDLISVIFGESARQCLMDNLNEIKTCQNKELYAIVRGFVVKLIENETFEFKMSADDCKAFDDGRNCFVSAIENCVDPAPKNYYTSMYEIIRKETSCATIASN